MKTNKENSIQKHITHPVRTISWAPPPKPNRKALVFCAIFILIPVSMLICLGLVFIITADRTNFLVLGLDSREAGSDLARSDTMILATFTPKNPYLGFLSIPRDLWVSIPDQGTNRINTAHFFAEADSPGSGPRAAIRTVSQNFNIDIHYYIRIRFDGFLDLVDSIGGVEVILPVAMSGLQAGSHHLTGEQSLAFVRDRAGSDDFYRMQRSQIFINALWERMLEPNTIRQLPDIIPILVHTVDTDMPAAKWIYLGMTMLQIGSDGIDSRVITREMTKPFTTSGGAQVLEPKWDEINLVLQELFDH